MLIFKEPQRQRLETKPHSSGVHPGLRPQPFPLPLPREGMLCGLASCGSSLQCCELKRADLFLHPHPRSNLLQRIKGVIPETLIIPRKRNWSLGPEQEAEMSMLGQSVLSSAAGHSTCGNVNPALYPSWTPLQEAAAQPGPCMYPELPDA